MNATRPPIQLSLDLPMPGGGEAPRPDAQEVEASRATYEPESSAWADRLMEAICELENVETAARAVMRNKGAPGVDGMTVKQLPEVLAERWPAIARALVEDRYRPQPARRVRIPKPDGGERILGIPTVIDRMIQQAILQRLQPEWDATFSEHSFGFRPGRSAHQAVERARQFIADDAAWCVDLISIRFSIAFSTTP